MNKTETKTTIIEAEWIRDSAKSSQYNCEGDLVWFPKKEVKYDDEKKELEVPDWLLKKTFPGENF